MVGIPGMSSSRLFRSTRPLKRYIPDLPKVSETNRFSGQLSCVYLVRLLPGSILDQQRVDHYDLNLIASDVSQLRPQAAQVQSCG